MGAAARMSREYYKRFDWSKNKKQLMMKRLLMNPPSGNIQHILLKGSVGSGKSTAIIAWAFENVLDRFPGAKWLVMRRTHGQIMGSIWEQINDFNRDFGIPVARIRGSKSAGPPEIVYPNGSKWVFWSSESVVDRSGGDTARGLGGTQYSGCTLEEPDRIHKEAIDTIPNRLREKSGVTTRVIFYSANPTPVGHWLHRMFEGDKDTKPGPDMHSITMTMWDNKHWLPPNYIESQVEYYKDKPGLMKRMVHGEWGPELKGRPYYSTYFDRAFHISRTSFIATWEKDQRWKEGPVCLCWDFGQARPALVVFQDVAIGETFRQIRVLAGFLGDHITLRIFAKYYLDEIYKLLPGAEFLTYCFDDKTEVLTRSGWKFFKDLQPLDMVATRSKNGEVEWQFPTQHIDQPYFGLMHRYDTPRVSFNVTPHHKFMIKGSREQRSIEEIHQLTEAKFPVTAVPYVGSENVCPLVSEFVGWWLADGTLSGGVRFNFTKQRKIGRLLWLLQKLGWKHKVYKRGGFHTVIYVSKKQRVFGQKLGDFLAPLWQPKKLPDNFLDWNLAARQSLLYALVSGDGHWESESTGTFNSTSYELAGQMQALLLSVGLSGNLKVLKPNSGTFDNARTCYRVNITPRATVVCHPGQIKRELYCGNVYCVSVPNRTLYVRRNGCVMWSGNCDPAGKQNDPRGVTQETAIDVLRSLHLTPNFKKSEVKGGVDLIIKLLQETINHRLLGVQPAIIIEPDPKYTDDIVGMFEAGYAQEEETSKGEFKPHHDQYYIHLADAFRYGVIHRRRLDDEKGIDGHRGPQYMRPTDDMLGAGLYVATPLDMERILGPGWDGGPTTAYYNF